MEESKNNLIVYDSASIQRKIYTLRDVQVMLDRDLANFYGVETKVLNQAVKRNMERFPEDFMFQLTKDEYENLMSQIAISSDHSLRSQIATLNKINSEIKDGRI